MDAPEWTNNFIGIPWKDKGRDRDGIDCWGCVRLVYREQYEILLPSYLEDYASPEEHAEIGSLILGETAKNWKLTLSPREGDAILFNVAGEPAHTAIYACSGVMLHIRRGAGSCLERYTTAIWSPRLLAFFTHPDRV